MAKRDYEYETNEYRVTSLLKGLRETILERRHEEEIECDVSDMIWMLFGTAVHSVLERQQEGSQEIKESRVKIFIGNYILSGQFDLYNGITNTITDYKTASVWKIIYASYDDWKRQLLIYAHMMQSIGFPVEKGEIVALLKDHSKRDAKVKKDYPSLPVHKVVFSFTEKDFAEIEEWLHKRFEEIAELEQLQDDLLPVCTPEERFNSGDKYAVMKKGRKTALRVLDNEEEATRWMGENKGDSIEIRLGEDKKCTDYCTVNQFCNYYQQKRGNDLSESRSF
jgi:hypothetical protein